MQKYRHTGVYSTEQKYYRFTLKFQAPFLEILGRLPYG